MTARVAATIGFDLGLALAWAEVLDGRLLDHGCFYLSETRPAAPARMSVKPRSTSESSPGRDSRPRVGLPLVLAGLARKTRYKRTLQEQTCLCEQAAGYVRHLLAEKRPARVVLEKPQVPTWTKDPAALKSKAQETDWLWLMASYLCREVGVIGARLVFVEAEEGFRALTGGTSGDKRVHVKFANARFGLKLRAGQDHEADAIGIALAGEAREGHEERWRRIGAK